MDYGLPLDALICIFSWDDRLLRVPWSKAIRKRLRPLLAARWGHLPFRQQEFTWLDHGCYKRNEEISWLCATRGSKSLVVTPNAYGMACTMTSHVFGARCCNVHWSCSSNLDLYSLRTLWRNRGCSDAWIHEQSMRVVRPLYDEYKSTPFNAFFFHAYLLIHRLLRNIPQDNFLVDSVSHQEIEEWYVEFISTLD